MANKAVAPGGALWSPAYVAIGSNLSEPERQVRDAFERLAGIKDSRLLARSRLYRTEPLGPQDQPQFVNACAGLLTQLSAAGLLGELKRIELAMGKVAPPVRWGPRLIDLDLLLFADERRAEAGLTLPHPGLHQRNFVLYPLADIAPTLMIQGHGRVADLVERVGAQGLSPL